MQLLKFQENAVCQISKGFLSDKLAVYTSGVGTGKTSVFCGVADRIPGKILYIIPKKAIIANVKNNKMFKQFSLESRTDFVTFNYFSDESKCDILDKYSLIIIDEAHHIGSQLFGSVLLDGLKARNVKTLGLTATPERMDGVNVTDLFDFSVKGLSNFEAITQGFMPRIEYLVCTPEELSGGDAGENRYSDIDWADSFPLLKDAVHDNPKKKWICFFSKIEELQKMKKLVKSLFPDYEILEIHSQKENTVSILNKANKLEKCVMLNCDMLLEGLHFENVDGILLFREVYSVPVFEQIIGRVSAMFKQENPLVIDCTNTWRRMDQYISFTDNGENDPANILQSKQNCSETADPNACNQRVAPCFVSLKNKKYYDYMKYLQQKFESSNYSVVYRNIRYSNVSECIKAFGLSNSSVLNRMKRNKETFEQAMDYFVDGKNLFWFRGEAFASRKEACKKYNIKPATVMYRVREKHETETEAMNYILDNPQTAKKWTAKEDAIMRQYYPEEGKNVVNRLPGRTKGMVGARACVLKLKLTKEHSPKWTDEEIEIIKSRYEKEGSSLISAIPRHSKGAIMSKAWELGIKYLPSWQTEEHTN